MVVNILVCLVYFNMDTNPSKILVPSIVYEDNDLLVINKPAGLLTHPVPSPSASYGTDPKSVVGWILQKYPQIKNIGDDPVRPGIVHRLDKYTSGLLLIAKTQATFSYLKKLFQERKIKKTYIALVHGELKNDHGIINLPLGKIGTKQTIKIHGKKELKEKEAVTEYKVTERFNDYTLLEVSPLTGRTHQIRIHLNSIHHPVVGDNLYGVKKNGLKINRLFLHAYRLEFLAPSGKKLLLETDLPQELSKALSLVNNTL